VRAVVEPALREAKPEERFQFERHGYFVADRIDSRPGQPVFNRAVTLRDITELFETRQSLAGVEAAT